MKKVLTYFLTVLLLAALLCACGEESASFFAPEPEDLYPETELTGVMSASEIAELDKYTHLQRLDLSGSDCYDAILAYKESHPQVEVIYTVDVGGGGSLVLPWDSTSVTLQDAALVEGLIEKGPYLPAVTEINIFNALSMSPEQLQRLQESYPDAAVTYNVEIGGTAYGPSTVNIDLSWMESKDVEDVASALALLPELETVHMTKADGSCGISLPELGQLQQAAPQAVFDYQFELLGRVWSTADERIEYIEEEVGEEGAQQIREVLPYMTNLSYLKLDSCEVPTDTLVALRDDFPEIKVVWRVYFNVYNCLTDTEKIWATGTVTDGYTHDLMYCTDVKYIDMGHNCITNIDFVNYMPNLEVAIFAVTWVESAAPLANCPNLEYLEIFSSHITDLSPLAGLTNLHHLNVSFLDVSDITPLYGLTNLERLRFTKSLNVPEEQKEEIRQLLPNCDICFEYQDPSGGNWRYDENGDRVERYELLAQQFGYDDLDYSW